MSLKTAIENLTGIKTEVNEPSIRKWSKCRKMRKHFISTIGEETITIDLDKNGQICGGTFAVTKKGWPCEVTKAGIRCMSPEGWEELMKF